MWDLLLVVLIGGGVFFAYRALKAKRVAPAGDLADSAVPVDAATELKDLPRRLYIEYRTRDGGLSKREIDAERLHADGGRLYVTGYCHRVEDERTFRADRIAAMVDRHSNAAFKGSQVQAALEAAAAACGVEIAETAPKESLEEARTRALDAFRDWAGRDDWVLLDCETNGHSKVSEILEISVINGRGETLIDATVLPMGRIPKAASDIHGLTRDKLKGSPIWPRVHDAVSPVLAAAPYVLAYNAEYDLRLLQQTAERYGLALPEMEWDCVMLAYAAYRAEPGKFGDAKWHKLEDAAAHEGIAVEGEHRALRNCMTTWRLIRKVGGENG